MGNQLVGVAPSQIYPVEHYLIDHDDLAFDQSLGSTRFFKVARAKHREGLLVVKVFAIQDPSLPLAIHREKLYFIKNQLATAVNCLPFQKVYLTEKAGLIIREYVKYSLYDRMSTRPFLTTLEKKWITFQLLYALHQCHRLCICHGDIKLENIMLTSWSWLLLTDFASFKPTFLPEDNPADYSYFFDTSRRRVCYIAPERFVKTLDNQHRYQGLDEKGLLLSESQCKVGELVPSMDIFSAGCALLELWNDGSPALDLSGLLAYRNTGQSPATMRLPLNSEPRLESLLESMTELDPSKRLSAEVYLDNERGKLFPEYFYSFLQSYMLIFSAHPILPPDEKILRIHQDIKSVVRILTQPEDIQDYSEVVQECCSPVASEPESCEQAANVVNIKPADKILLEQKSELSSPATPPTAPTNQDNEGLILLTSLVTSCIRGLHHCTSKLRALDILMELCDHCTPETALDRILPYVIHLTHDPVSRVRACAVRCVARLLSHNARHPHANHRNANRANVFPEYVLPELAGRATDRSLAVRQALADCIPVLAETALIFLDDMQTANVKENSKVNYETELLALHEMVRSIVSTLLTDPQAIVRRALVENGITKLCHFFGKQKANDVILSHCVTFLNDKEETALRLCFFDCIVPIASYVGIHCAPILMPLLQQGLTDKSEFIIAKALRATSCLAELGLLQKPTLCEIVAESVCYLPHPNLWIRHEICGLISTIASLLNPIDVNCKILPLVWPHLKHKLTQVDKPELLLESLMDPIPRHIFDTVMRYKDINQLIEIFRERRATRLKVKQGTMPQYCESSQEIKNLFRRLQSDGMTDHMESQILAMSAHLIKIKRSASHGNNQNQLESPGKMVLPNMNGLSKSINLDVVNIDVPQNSMDSSSNTKRNRRGSSSSHQSEGNIVTDWQHMYMENPDYRERSPSQSKSISIITSTPQAKLRYDRSLSSSASQVSRSGGAGEESVEERSYVQYRLAPCRAELRKVATRMQLKYARSLRTRHYSEPLTPVIGWKAGNTLLANLHEHTSSVTNLISTRDASKCYLLSSSTDGKIKLWDVGQIEAGSYINRSKTTYDLNAGGIVSMVSCENDQSVAVSTFDGHLVVLRLDTNARFQQTHTKQLDLNEEVQLACSPLSDHIVYCTLNSVIYGWDLRAPSNCWKLEGDLRLGVMSCLHMSKDSWLAVGTNKGAVTLYDLRFLMPVTSLQNPNGGRIRRIIGAGDSKIWTCGAKEASMWCCESGQKRYSVMPYSSQSTQYVSSIYSSPKSSFLLTGGSDCRVRYWDLQNPESSHILINAYSDPFKSNDGVSYRSNILEGVNVVQEVSKSLSNQFLPSLEESIYKLCENKSYYHLASITDMILVKANKTYLATASQDGAINIWK